MKIGNNAPTTAITPVSASRPSARSVETPRDGQGTSVSDSEASATVQISNTATALLDGVQGGFDADKVDRVRQAISSGTYKINAEAIADKLIANAQDLLGKIGSGR